MKNPFKSKPKPIVKGRIIAQDSHMFKFHETTRRVNPASRSERTTYNHLSFSSKITNMSSDMIIGNFAARRIAPDLPFMQMREYYETISRVQNVVDSMVDNVINREWFIDDTTDGGKGGAYTKEVKIFENWRDNEVDTRLLMGNVIRNWLIFGLAIVSPADWKLLQMESLISKSQDDYGNTIRYIQQINGKENHLDANLFFEIPFIELDRKPWGVSLFASGMNVNYVDIDGEFPQAPLAWYRQNIQDDGRTKHRYGSPKVMYFVDGEEQVNQDTIDNEIAPLIEGQKPGDRIIVSKKLGMIAEPVDGASRFVDAGKKIQEDVDIALHSSDNRVITEPSAMADAREAGSRDDDRTLGVMAKIEIFFNKVVIPEVTGDHKGHVKFKWGAKDTFDLNFPEALEKAIAAGVVLPIEAREMLAQQHHWKIPEISSEDQKKRQQMIIDSQPPQEEDPQTPNEPDESTKAESIIIKQEYMLQQQKKDIMDKIQKELEGI